MPARRLRSRLSLSGRKPLLVLGWISTLPVPFLIIFAPSWSRVAAANVLLGMNQGLAWTVTVTGKIDLVGSEQRGFALGFNEFSGYAGVSLGRFVGGYLGRASGLRTAPFLFVLAVILLMLLASLLFMRETKPSHHGAWCIWTGSRGHALAVLVPRPIGNQEPEKQAGIAWSCRKFGRSMAE